MADGYGMRLRAAVLGALYQTADGTWLRKLNHEGNPVGDDALTVALGGDVEDDLSAPDCESAWGE